MVAQKHPKRQKASLFAHHFEHLLIYGQCSTLSAGEHLENLTRRSTKPEPALATTLELPNWLLACKAAESKKAIDLRVLDLREITSFTDFFIISSVSNPRQGHAVCDEISKQLKEIGELPVSVEGYEAAEWILMDYGDFIVHLFSQNARTYYDLERLWRHAKAVDLNAVA